MGILKMIRILGLILSFSMIFTGTVFMFSSLVGMNLGIEEIGLSVRLVMILGITISIVGLIGIITFHFFFRAKEQ